MYITFLIDTCRCTVVRYDCSKVRRAVWHKQEEVPTLHQHIMKSTCSACLPPFVEAYLAVVVCVYFVKELVEFGIANHDAAAGESLP